MASEPKQMPKIMNFIFGGSAGMMATCIVQPLDLIKTRMQTQSTGAKREYENSLDCLKKVIKNEGIFAMYKGLGAALLRQATYTTGRLGVYTSLLEHYKLHFDAAPNLPGLMCMGMIAGACGAFIGTPAEVVLIRMTADGRLPPAERRNYKNIVNAFARIIKEEGVLTLWRGAIATMGRAVVVNMVQLASYSQLKAMLKSSFELPEGLPLHFYSSMMSGFLTTTASLPVDIAKTRIQNMKYIQGKPRYTGTIHVLTSIIKHEGVPALWKGFIPYFCRIGPHTVFTFIFLEQMTKIYRANFLN